MRQLLGSASMDDSVLRRIFTKRLPPACRAILAGRSDIRDLNELADIADDVHDVTTSSATTAAAPLPPIPLNAIEEMQQEILALRRDFQVRGQRREHGSAPRAQDRQSGAGDLHDGMCWYHSTFGPRARKCRDGCRYARSGNGRPAQ